MVYGARRRCQFLEMRQPKSRQSGSPTCRRPREQVEITAYETAAEDANDLRQNHECSGGRFGRLAMREVARKEGAQPPRPDHSRARCRLPRGKHGIQKFPRLMRGEAAMKASMDKTARHQKADLHEAVLRQSTQHGVIHQVALRAIGGDATINRASNRGSSMILP